MINSNYKEKKNKSKSQMANQTLKPREVIQLAKDSVRIEAVLDKYLGVNLSNAKGGRTKLIKCPFHDEKTPSFAVTPSENKFKCFSCDSKGDSVSLIARLKNIGQARAAYILCEDFGLAIKDNRGNKRFQAAAEVKQKVLSSEEERELRRREHDAFNALVQIEHDLILPLIKQARTPEESARRSKLYHLKSEIAMFLDLLTYTEGADHVSRELNLMDIYDWYEKKIKPIIAIVEGVRK